MNPQPETVHIITRQYLYLDGNGRSGRQSDDRGFHPVAAREPLEDLYRHLDEIGWPRDISVEGYAAALEATGTATPPTAPARRQASR